MPVPPPPSSNFVRKYVPGTFFRTMLARRWDAAPRRTVGTALLLALCLAACGGDDAPPAAEAGGDPTVVTREETTTASTATSGTTGTAPPGPTAFTAEARDAVNELKTAWEAGDRDRAATVAPGDVVEALFVVPPGGFEVYGCDTGEFDTSTCNLRNRSTGVYITLTSERHPEGWQVATVFVDQG